jgi:hypothetical protein
MKALQGETLQGRALGTVGMQTTAAWIAESFKRLELQPAGELFTYFQTRDRDFELLLAEPVLAFDVDMPGLTFQNDFNIYPSMHTISGSVQAPVTFLALGEVGTYERLGYRYYELDDLDYSEEVLMVFPEDMFYVDQLPHAGAIVVAMRDEILKRNYSLSPYDGFGRGAPSLWISEDVADRLLRLRGYSVHELYAIYKDLGEDEIYELDLDAQAAMQVPGEAVEGERVQHVIGHWQGFVSNEFEGIDDELFIVLAQYDCPPLGPNGVLGVCPESRSAGLAMMLEVIRAMHAAEYQPYRTFLFVAYSGEGYEGGARFLVDDVDKFLEAKYGFDSAYDLLGVIELGPFFPGQEDELVVRSDGSLRLTQLFEDAANDHGLKVERVGADLDLERIFQTGSTIESGARAPWIEISTQDVNQVDDRISDYQEEIDPQYLERVGRALTQTLMVLGRELDY